MILNAVMEGEYRNRKEYAEAKKLRDKFGIHNAAPKRKVVS